MTIWDTLTGRSPPKPSSAQPATAASDATPSDSFPSQSLNASNIQDLPSLLGPNSTFDPSSLHPLAGLNRDTLDYLSLEDTKLSDLPGAHSALPSRGWTDDLCYGTGVTYLAALSLGGAWGLAEGLSRSPASAPPKLRLNSILNAVTRRGPFLGNSAGVIAMVYNGFNSTIGHYRGKHDSFNSVAAGALSGMLFKSTKGLRPMVISGGMVASTAGLWTVGPYVILSSVRLALTNLRSQKAHFSSASRLAGRCHTILEPPLSSRVFPSVTCMAPDGVLSGRYSRLFSA